MNESYDYINEEKILVSSKAISENPYTWGHDRNKEDLKVVEKFLSYIEDDSTVIDIGSQSGYFCLSAKFYPKSKWYAFEPNETNYSLLCENLQINGINNVTALNEALSSEVKTSTLNVCTVHGGLHTLGENIVRFSEEQTTKQVVNVDTIDNLFLNIKVDLIKIDTEGAEYDILKGGIETIKKYRPKILLEYYEPNLVQFNKTLNDLNNLIKEIGYEIFWEDGENIFIQPKNNLKNFPPVYYVTLEDCLERQEQIEREFKSYGVIPNAVKSKKYSESNDIITGKYVYQLTGPTQGCIVSHLKAIKKWYDSEESDYAFFCEDDLSLKTVDYWNFEWEEFIQRLPDDCECVQLMSIRANFDGVYFRERQWNDWSETAYIMNRDYAKKLIDTYCVGDTFHLELKNLDVMPIGENILFTNMGKVYTFPLFVENIEIPTTDVNDSEVEDGQKPNHIYSSEYVYNWWLNNGKNMSIDDLMKNKRMRHNVVDCFSYFNERELLELRVNLLKDYVDKFIIVDANYSHSGIPKDYSCKQQIKILGLPEEMIEVIEVDLSDENLGSPSDYDLYWDNTQTIASRERVQRDSIAKCLETNDFDSDTVFIVGDCDEIVNPKYIGLLGDLAREHRDKIFKVDLDYLSARADLQVYDKDSNSPSEWRYSLFFCLKEHLETTSLTQIRSNIYNPYPIVWAHTTPREENGVHIPGEIMKGLGWHFSWMGSNKDRLLKSKCFCHAGQNCDSSGQRKYGDDSMDDFIINYTPKDGSDAPSGFLNNILKKYPIENLPQKIFELPRVKDFLLPDNFFTEDVKSVEKIELEDLLREFSLDTENPEKNFNLGIWYENEGHTAPAVSYYLRCAERAAETDENLAYESLIRASYCYEQQGTRDGSARSLLWQAQMFLPKRPEAHYLLSVFAQKREWWQDSYCTAELCLNFCDFDLPPLRTDVKYPGKYGILFAKAISGWQWGKGDESRSILKKILLEYNLSSSESKLIADNLRQMNGEP